MGQLLCQRIGDALAEVADRYGWDDYVYIFTQSRDWLEPGATFVSAASERGQQFLAEFATLGIKYTWLQLNTMKSDLPQVFDVAQSLAVDADRKAVELIRDQGWRSGLSWSVYGHGGALGFLVLYSREPGAAARLAEATTDCLCRFMYRFSAWAREEIANARAVDTLSPRETQCMLLVADGRKSKEIAHILHISQRTVEFHIQNAMHKLGGTSRSQAASRLTSLSSPQQLNMAVAALRDQAGQPAGKAVSPGADETLFPA